MTKADVRAEIESMTNAFLESGGRISRDKSSKVHIACTGCHYRRYVDVSFAMKYPRCIRCGAATRVEP